MLTQARQLQWASNTFLIILSHNEVKSLDFEVNVKPLQDARFPGGQQKLKDYLASNAVDKIPEEVSNLQILQRFNLQSMNQEKSSMHSI
ncbi:MAG: hypothetical protein IPI22_15075 [Bacteroidetes bacterium]|nr:hypothetical protein [Bacteroidota bacterium]